MNGPPLNNTEKNQKHRDRTGQAGHSKLVI